MQLTQHVIEVAETDFHTLIIRLLFAWIVLVCFFLSYRIQILSTSKKQLLGIFTRFITSWLVLFFLYTYFYSSITDAMLPMFNFAINLIQRDYIATLSNLTNTTGQFKISIKILHHIPPFTTGTILPYFFYFLTILQTVALLPAILIAWPVNRIEEHFFLMLISIPLSLATLAMVVPFLIANQIETTFVSLAKFSNLTRPDPFYQLWTNLLTSEGGILLIFFMVLLATKLQKKIFLLTKL